MSDLHTLPLNANLAVVMLTLITAIGEGGGIRVWAFSSHRRGFSWSSSNTDQIRVRKCKVLNDELGLRVEDEMDEEGDWQMREAPPLEQYSAFDGSISDTLVPNPLTLPAIDGPDATQNVIDEDEGYFSAEDNHSTTAPNAEIRPRRQNRLHNTPLQRSDVSMKDVSGNSYASAIPYQTIGIPGTHYNPNKRRRLNTTLSHSKPDTEDRKSSFDPDQQTIEWVGSAFAISIPSTKRRWSGSGVEAEDWVPDYLGMGEEWDEQDETERGEEVDAGHETEYPGLDLWSLAR